LFKWLISAFTEEFFAHYFPSVTIGKYRFFDKEFLSKYEALQESLEGDLFLLMEIEINGQLQEVAIQIEHQSKKVEIGERLFEYLCYVWLLKKQPVWSIVIYTDDAVWRKPVAEKYCYGFSFNQQQQYFHFDVIKVNAETSQDLMQKHSLLCRLLALKANDKGADPEQLIRAVYEAVTVFKPDLTSDQLLLVNRWVEFYKKVPPRTFQQIKKEFNVAMIETTISEHIFNQGLAKGKIEGLAEGVSKGKAEGKAEGIAEGVSKGKAEGKAEGLEQQIMLLKALHEEGVLSKSRLKNLLLPLEAQLKALKH
jgi:hypothetical protein